MPWWRDKVGLGKDRDARIKLTDDDKKRVVELYDTGLWSKHALAREFVVSKRLIQFILNPEAQEQNLRRRAERGGSKQYYDTDTRRQSQRRHRDRKRRLIPDSERRRPRQRFHGPDGTEYTISNLHRWAKEHELLLKEYDDGNNYKHPVWFRFYSNMITFGCWRGWRMPWFAGFPSKRRYVVCAPDGSRYQTRTLSEWARENVDLLRRSLRSAKKRAAVADTLIRNFCQQVVKGWYGWTVTRGWKRNSGTDSV